MFVKLGIDNDKAQKLIAITMECGQFEEVIQNIESLSDNETYQKGVKELKEVFSYLNVFQ